MGVNVQEWLDQNYPKEEGNEIKEIYLNELNLEGELDLRDFEQLEKVYISLTVDENKLGIKNLPRGTRIIKLINAQELIDK
jgi:hypothetical protein